MKKRYIGIWMDHASANLMVLTSGGIQTKTIGSKFTHEEKMEISDIDEKKMHHREQHEELAYYKEIAAIIRNYDKVLIFGPTEAKDELVNLLKADHGFDKISIEVRQSDKMTEKEQHAFVEKYFHKELSAIV